MALQRRKDHLRQPRSHQRAILARWSGAVAQHRAARDSYAKYVQPALAEIE
jgi:hypothetical protein